MDMKPGYKQTEIGVLPKDWDIEALGPHVEIKSGESPSLFHFESEGIPYYKVEQLNSNSKYLRDTPYFIRSNKRIASGSLIFPKRGASILLNKIRILGTDSFMDTNLMTLTPKASVHNEFLYYALIHVELWRIADTTSIPQINNKHIIPLVLALPPTKAEQEAIAEALSDTDALIESLEQLIIKKRNLKQGTMQELFTGKKRLPWFAKKQSKLKETVLGRLPEDWTIVEVKHITRNHKQGYYTKDLYVDNGVKLVRITDLLSPRIDYTTMPMLQLSESDHDLYRINVGDFLFARSGAIGRYGIVYKDIDAVFGSYIIRFSFDSARLNNEYFGYLYETELVRKQLLSITQGSSNININASNIKSIKIPLPQIDEQTAMAAILSDMDAEITALENKLSKAHQIKQGMLQELLTGRIRLI